ncbi:Pex2 / Pex12 amino terminal domain-containing protein [Neospora caninum Liverpool]|uniref:Pex2 / Pex12 amino terminal domain-containing protein n=1 Tax=Neospora caninum (strain Liverpool) TaxID=572307 RepID=F0VH42_NEOCL|nr:Pex2 / Pex12 amino terminal domain-containing protein [Neospora caninum Liverpool]CBZ53036.1 Pex2 / Pex12 amino terminal domain-containing protein [Neospora caninum Liverpool]CEL67020.1 TPA: Pex2 / Pex12 amino terminal domain-containing protein, putative [Neospora caninum Liverpool]|eukprot:XP_003883068.1 Pex2 / Pex12 amino terminal domain-containing protein [Neospora caninum Liverpool]
MRAPSRAPRMLRVNQLDALRVDQELVLLLQEEANGILRHLFPLSTASRQRELFLAFQLFFFCAYTLRNRPSPGDLLQNVKYRSQPNRDEAKQSDGCSKGPSKTEGGASEPISSAREGDPAFLLEHARREWLRTGQQSGIQVQQFLPKRKKFLILLFSILLPYGFEVLHSAVTERYLTLLSVLQQRARRAEARRRFQAQQRRDGHPFPNETHASAAGERTVESGAVVQSLTLTRDERLVIVLYRACQLMHTFLMVLQLVQAIFFLLDGNHRSLTDWLLGLEMEFIAPSLPRSISLELLQHQLYWQAFTQLLLLVVPNLPQHRLLLQRLVRLRRTSGGRRAALRHRLAVWLRTKEAELRKRETEVSGFQSPQSTEQIERPRANSGGNGSDYDPKSRQGPSNKTVSSRDSLSSRPKTTKPAVSRSHHPEGRQAIRSNVKPLAIRPPRAPSDTASIPRTIRASCRILWYRSLRAACAGLARLTGGGSDTPASGEGEYDRIAGTKSKVPSGDGSRALTSEVTSKQAFAEEVDNKSDFTEEENAPCVFCGKEDILLPFRGDACRHHFCYWCAASHPCFRFTPPNDGRTREGRGGNGATPKTMIDAKGAECVSELAATEDEEILECPACGAEIRSIAWAQ